MPFTRVSSLNNHIFFICAYKQNMEVYAVVYLLILCLILFFIPPLAVYAKLFKYGASGLFLQFIIFLSFNSYYMALMVLKKLCAYVSREKVIKSKSRIRNYYLAFTVWGYHIPFMFAQVGILIIESSNAIQHKYRRASNDCYKNLILYLEKCA